MRKRSALFGVACAVLGLALPLSTATASPAAATSAARSPSVITHQVTACGHAMTVYTPRTPGAALSASALGMPGGPHSVLGMAAQRHVRWLSTITCRTVPARPLPQAAPRLAANHFLNWAGYVDPTTNPNYAQASWYVPLVCCVFHGPDFSSIWPGIGDGTTRGTGLIQDGTEQDVSNSNHATYYFWIETFPNPQQRITNLIPHVGDHVAASASWATVKAGNASFVVCDLTQGKCVAGTEAAHHPNNHAEWIVERTSYCKASDHHYWIPALSSFSVAEFADGYYDLTGTQLPAFPISHGHPVTTYMVNSNGETISTPARLTNGGTAFHDIWNDYGTPTELNQRC